MDNHWTNNCLRELRLILNKEVGNNKKEGWIIQEFRHKKSFVEKNLVPSYCICTCPNNPETLIKIHNIIREFGKNKQNKKLVEIKNITENYSDSK